MHANEEPGTYRTVSAAAQARRGDLTKILMAKHAGRVASGPFAGMQMLPDTSWGDGDLSCKLLGCYEQELHPSIERAIDRAPAHIINAGCAEGYYVVGLALRLPHARVTAFDISGKAQDICRRAAEANNVSNRITLLGECEPAALGAALGAEHERTLIVCDCEGAELSLIDPAQTPALRRCDMIVECHDFIEPSITATLRTRLADSHEIETISEGPRDPNAFAAMRGWQSLDRWLAVSEGRPCTMNWLTFWARA